MRFHYVLSYFNAPVFLLYNYLCGPSEFRKDIEQM